MKTRLILAISLVASLGIVHAQTPNTLSECEKQEGFKLLFDGTIESFRSQFTEYKMVTPTNPLDNNLPISSQYKLDAATQSIASGPSQPDVRSKVLYTDFDLRIQYRNSGNQGVFYRFNVNEFEPWYTGIEVAIEDNVNIANQKTAAGAVYDMFPPAVKNYKAYATGLWNDLRIIAKGDSVEHWMNGARIISFKYHSPAWFTAVQNSKWKDFPGYCVKVRNDPSSGPIREGYIGFQGNHGGQWRLRNIRLNSTSSAVKFGPECTTPNGIHSAAAPEKRSSFTFERSMNSVNLRLDGIKADAISLMALNGREVVRAKVGADGQTARLSGWGHPGVYLLKASASGRTVLSDKIFLQ
jgi:hypothetical protein